MSYFRRLSNVLALVVCSLTASSALAATNPHVTVRPQARIVQKFDATKVVPLAGTVPARVASLVDMGRVSGNTQFNRMVLVLKSSDEQEFALQGLLDQQQDKSSPNYHQWMTPETFGATFGPASSDIAQVTSWLGSAGFTIDLVAKSGRLIEFSGTAAQVEAAFHTEMHQYEVNGEVRVSNATDISIPAAFSPVVAGVATLNNFRRTSNVVNKGKMVVGKDGQMYPAITGSSAPDYTSLSSGRHSLGAADLATIFNTNPLLTAGNSGQGQTIGIIGQTDILLSDILIYRQIFGLPINNPTFTQIGNDPGTIGDDIESDLDVELSGALAPLAKINFVTSGNSYFGGGIEASIIYLVENNNADIISLSYGGCEVNNAPYGVISFYQVAWEQAAAQGQSAFVSTGDSGPAVCDSSSATYERNGYNINALGSSTANVAVGGTEFNEGTATGPTQYWGPGGTYPYGTALSYIPETVWNDGLLGPYGGSGIGSASSGVSFYTPKPNFQVGPGVPTSDPTPNSGIVSTPYGTSGSKFQIAGPHRLVPDVSLEAAGGHDPTLICSEGSCLLNPDGTVASLGAVGGTSVAAPSMAGVQALINQKNGGRQGNPNFYYYRIAALQSSTTCNSATYVIGTATASCGFHDIQVGNNNIPANSAGTSYIGWSAGPGYDMAVGLGSPDVTNLANLWKTISFNATTTAFTLTPTTSAHGATYNVTGTVTPVSGTGIPTGDVTIIAQALYGGLGYYTLSAGSNTFTGTLQGLPGGTYNVYARYGGDTTFGASTSAPISVTVTPEASQVNVNSELLATTGVLTPTTTFTYGANVYFDAGVSSASGVGTPTGGIQFVLKNGALTYTPPVSNLDSFDDTYFDAGLGLAAYDIKATYPVLPTGTYSVTSTYSGDTTFNSSTGKPFTIVIGPATPTITLRLGSLTVPKGGTATLTAQVTTISGAAGGLPATGTVTFTDTTTNTVVGTGTLVNTGSLSNASVTVTSTALNTLGGHSITATYSGDANYATGTSLAQTLTVGGTTSSVTLAVTSGGVPVTTTQVDATVTLTATPLATATGIVYFYDNGVYFGGANISTTTHTAVLATSSLTAGAHSFTAVYNGNATLDTSTSAASPLTVTLNTPTLQATAQAATSTGTAFGINAVLTPSPLSARPSIPAPTGVISFIDTPAAPSTGPVVTLGTAPIAFLPNYQNYTAGFTTKALVPGYHTLSATYAGDANYASANSNVTPLIGIGITTLNLATSATNVGTGTPFTLTATVVPVIPSTPTITGTVSFYDGAPGGTLLGTSTVGTGGVATLTTTKVTTVGTHGISAVYSGDQNYYTSTNTGTVNIVFVTPGFTIAVNPTSLTVAQGSTGTVQVTATTYGNYNGTAPLTCSGLPANAFCTFTFNAGVPPQYFTMPGTDATFGGTLTITALKPHVVKAGGFTPFLWLPVMLLAGFLGLRRKSLSVRGRQIVVLAILMCGTLATTACSTLGLATPAGTYTVTVTANGVPNTAASPGSPAIQPTTTLALTVTQ